MEGYRIASSKANERGQTEILVQGPGLDAGGLKYIFGSSAEAESFLSVLNVASYEGMQKGRQTGLDQVLSKADDRIRPVARKVAAVFFGALTLYILILIIAILFGIDIIASGSSTMSRGYRLLFLVVLLLTGAISFVFFRGALKGRGRIGPAAR